jgi:hypothetical protein
LKKSSFKTPNVKSPSKKRRKLSAAGEARAIQSGIAFLDEQREKHAAAMEEMNEVEGPDPNASAPEPAWEYAGDQWVSVIYQDDDGEIYHVTVTRSSTD